MPIPTAPPRSTTLVEDLIEYCYQNYCDFAVDILHAVYILRGSSRLPSHTPRRLGMNFQTLSLALLLSAPMYATAGNGNADATRSMDTVTVQDVEYRHRPPFKRSLEVLPAADMARQEAAQTVVVHDTDFSGKPPFKRNVEVMRVVDTAVMETSEQDDQRVRGPRHHYHKIFR